MMARSRALYVVLVVALLGEAFSVPVDIARLKRGYADNELDSTEGGVKDLVPEGSQNRATRQEGGSVTDSVSPTRDEHSNEGESKVETSSAKPEFATPVSDDDDSDEDDDDFEPMNTAPTAGGGSNIFSLLRLANAIFPSSSGANFQRFMRRMLRRYFNNQLNLNGPVLPDVGQIVPNYLPLFNPLTTYLRRADVADNLLNTKETQDLKPPLQRRETEEDDDDTESEESDENNAAETIEDDDDGDNGVSSNASKAKSGSDESGQASDENDSDYSDEPPEGDGQGGGILGLLAGLSGGEDGQSDLGSLLATISGIVVNLSGDGVDLNSIIGSGIGLFVGLLSEGEENPGAVIAQYLLTSLDSITGGGSQNNGAFFGNFVSKLIRGISAGENTGGSSEENGKEPPKDSGGFISSFLMGLLGDMSKMSFGGSKSSSCSSSCGGPDTEQI